MSQEGSVKGLNLLRSAWCVRACALRQPRASHAPPPSLTRVRASAAMCSLRAATPVEVIPLPREDLAFALMQDKRIATEVARFVSVKSARDLQALNAPVQIA